MLTGGKVSLRGPRLTCQTTLVKYRGNKSFYKNRMELYLIIILYQQLCESSLPLLSVLQLHDTKDREEAQNLTKYQDEPLLLIKYKLQFYLSTVSSFVRLLTLCWPKKTPSTPAYRGIIF